MWLITTFGFFSVVQKPTDVADGTLTIRARVKHDLVALKQKYLPGLSPIATNEGTDYPYRATATRSEIAYAFGRAIKELDYTGFKDAVEERQGGMRAKLYCDMGQILYELQRNPLFDAHVPMADAYGGVVMSGGGKVLLRAPTKQHGGYAWTFAKTAGTSADAPEKTAMIAVYQKTGYVARIRADIPGVFESGDSSSAYFLMEVDYRAGEPNWQTSELRWASLDEARELIGRSSNLSGRGRDLAVLEAADAVLKTIPYSEHLSVQPEDWDGLQSMPARHVVLHPRISYSAGSMAAIRRGFYPTVMEQKWFLVFVGNRLRMHRSWTGYLVFDVGFEFGADGGANVSEVIVNRDHSQYGEDDDEESLSLMETVIQQHLLEPLDEPTVDGFVLAAQQALQPNYLGSPEVVGKLVERIIDVVVRDYLADPESRDDVLTPREQQVLGEILPAEIDRGTLIREVIFALAGLDESYTAMPWHNTDQLGWNIMQYLTVETTFTGYESLYELVAEGMKQVIDKAYELLMGYFEDPRAMWDEHVAEQLQELCEYVSSVMLGTNAMTHAEKTLQQFHWRAAA